MGSYGTKSCYVCGYKDTADNMTRREYKRKRGETKDGIGLGTLIGFGIGDKKSANRINKVLFSNNKRNHYTNTPVWLCYDCAGEKSPRQKEAERAEKEEAKRLAKEQKRLKREEFKAFLAEQKALRTYRKEKSFEEYYNQQIKDWSESDRPESEEYINHYKLKLAELKELDAKMAQEYPEGVPEQPVLETTPKKGLISRFVNFVFKWTFRLFILLLIIGFIGEAIDDNQKTSTAPAVTEEAEPFECLPGDLKTEGVVCYIGEEG